MPFIQDMLLSRCTLLWHVSLYSTRSCSAAFSEAPRDRSRLVCANQDGSVLYTLAVRVSITCGRKWVVAANRRVGP
ncbi:hypothetical protein BDV19DRAFT_369081 [Aspergillus venezuelensis]